MERWSDAYWIMLNGMANSQIDVFLSEECMRLAHSIATGSVVGEDLARLRGQYDALSLLLNDIVTATDKVSENVGR